MTTCGAQMQALPVQVPASYRSRRFDRNVVSHRRSRSIRVQASKQAHVPAVTPAPEAATWDPEGLLSRIPAGGGQFARRERHKSG